MIALIPAALGMLFAYGLSNRGQSEFKADALTVRAGMGKAWQIRTETGSVSPLTGRNQDTAARRTAPLTASGELSLRFETGTVLRYEANGILPLQENESRDFALPERSLNGVIVSRKLHFSQYFPMCRRLDSFTNTTGRTVRFEVRLSVDPGLGAGWAVTSSDDGDAFIGTADRWFTASESPTAGQEPVLTGHILQGCETRAPLVSTMDNALLDGSAGLSPFDKPGWTYAVELEPGQTGVLLTMMTAADDGGRFREHIRALSQLTAGACEGLSDVEKSQVLNFSSEEFARAAAGPIVQFIAPTQDALIVNPVQFRVRAESDADLVSITVRYTCHDYDYYSTTYNVYSDTTTHPSPYIYALSLNLPECSCNLVYRSISVGVVDQNGNMGGATIDVKDGNIRLQIASPHNGDIVKGIVPIEVAVSGIDPNWGWPCDSYSQHGGRLTISGPGYNIVQNFALTLSYSWYTDGLRPGDYLIRGYYSYGYKGSSERSEEIKVRIEPSNLPSVQFLKPIEGQTVSGAVPIEFEASYSEGVKKTALLVDGQGTEEKILAPPTPKTRFATVWDATKVEPFTLHRLTGTATDVYGRKGETTITVRVTGVGIALQGKRIKRSFGPTPYTALLTFQAANPDALPLAKFAVYRRIGNGDFVLMGEIAAGDKSEFAWADHALTSSSEATYSIVALDAAGNPLGRSPDLPL